MRNSLFVVATLVAAVSIPVRGATAPTNATIPPGYSMTAVATGLNFPTAMTFFGNTIWVTEAGIAGLPTVKTVDRKGNVATSLLRPCSRPEHWFHR